MVSDMDTNDRVINSASAESPALFQIHTDSALKLRIRLLEIPPKTEPKLMEELYIFNFPHYCEGLPPISILQNGTLGRDKDFTSCARPCSVIVSTFVHQSRIFYIKTDFKESYEIFTDSGKFFTSLPKFITFNFDLNAGHVISYDNKLLFIPKEYFTFSYGLLMTVDFFRSYEIIPGNEHLNNPSSTLLDIWRVNSVTMFENEVLVITEYGTQFYNGQAWENFEIDWGDLEVFGRFHVYFHPMVVHTQTSDCLFAFTGHSGRGPRSIENL